MRGRDILAASKGQSIAAISCTRQGKWSQTGDLGRKINRANPVAEAAVGGLQMGPGGKLKPR